MSSIQRILNLVLLPLVILGAFLIVKAMIASKPERTAQKPPVVVPSVTYIESSEQSIVPTISTYGTVQSFYEAELSSQLSGEIISVAAVFNSGQAVSKGELLVEIDPADYLAIISQEEAALATVEQALLEEQTRSRLAAEDWLESGRELQDATDLTLRKPQLGAAEASVASAEATVQKARLDLARTKIRAPYDAIVQSRTTSPGNYVNAGSTLGQLVATERVEVRLPLTPEQVTRIDLPQIEQSSGKSTGLEATLTTPSQPGVTWLASITRTEPSVDTQNQVIYVVGEVEKPFADPRAFLPVGAFVNAHISAKEISAAHRIPATSLVEDAYVWLIDVEETLQKLPATRIVADGEALIVRIDRPSSGGPPLRIATRPLASFRQGQKVKPVTLDR